MKKMKSHKWIFTSRFRTNAYSWKASKLACKRIKEAVSEIKKAARQDPALGAEGSIKFMENGLLRQWKVTAIEGNVSPRGGTASHTMGVLWI